MKRDRTWATAAGLAAAAWMTAAGAQAAPVVFTVEAPASVATPLQGRMLVFAQPLAEAKAAAKGGAVTSVDAGSFDARGVAVAGQDVDGLHGGQTVAVDADVQAFPSAFSALPAGRYAVQAVLDQGTPYNYAGRGAGDLVSQVAEVELPAGAAPVLHLGAPLPERDPWTPSPSARPEQAAQLAAARADTTELNFTSPVLSRFWGRPTSIRGWIVTPPGYKASRDRYPVVYWTHGFGATHAGLLRPAAEVRADMASGRLPPMIWVLLDEDLPTGTHEFADSVNNGPWGAALTTELIPELERSWRMDARPGGRFLTGHSSGGWATLWLQVRYPRLFGGSWPTSPDPSDFHDFTGVDAYAPAANVYRRPDSTPWPLIRDKGGKVLATLEDFTRLEDVIGPIGGQQSSFDWVFSPKGPDGRPLRMFDRSTGIVDPAVLAYWREHYDVAHIVQRDWPTLRPDLDGKIHLVVGTADTFYLDGAAHRLDAVFQRLGARMSFRYVPGRTHGDLYRIGQDRTGLQRVIAWEMYALARPGAKPPADLPQVPTS